MNAPVTPTGVAIALLGTYREVARACGLSDTVIHNWARPSAHRDAGDIPSARHQRAILAACERLGLPSERVALVLIRGASPAELAELVALRDAAGEAPKVAAE